MFGFSLYCLNLMMKDEPDGGLAVATAGVLPNHEDADADGPVAVAKVDVAASHADV